MTTREQFKRKVIESIHRLPYDEAIKKELDVGCIVRYCYEHSLNSKSRTTVCKNGIVVSKVFGSLDFVVNFDLQKTNRVMSKEDITRIIGLPITIGRVMQAFRKSTNFLIISSSNNDELNIKEINPRNGDMIAMHLINLKLTKENGQECTDDGWSEETIEQLLNLMQ